MKYLFENAEICGQALAIINNNKGYDGVTKTHDLVNLVNNPEHEDYNKAYIEEVQGDEEHNTLWLTCVEGVFEYDIVEYDYDWVLFEL